MENQPGHWLIGRYSVQTSQKSLHVLVIQKMNYGVNLAMYRSAYRIAGGKER